MRIRLGSFLFVTIVACSILGGLFGNRVNAGPPLEESSQNLLKAFTDSLVVIQEQYARDVSSEKLIESAIRGMLRTLDPHSSFFSRRDYDRLQKEQKGKYYGLGITIRAESPGTGRVLVVEPPAPGTPAYKAGLKAGDVIAKIRIDERLESYRTFFDHQWANDILTLVAGTRLEPRVDALTIHWKSVANAHLMPWLVTEALKNLAEGYVLADRPFAVQLVDVMKLRLVNEIGNALSHSQAIGAVA